jgi:1-acyl-sn-glycerol-3-phosphate acyltransferase
LFVAGLPKPGRVQIAFGEPIPVTQLAATPDAAGELLGKDLWPKVEQEYSRLRSRPGLIAAGLAAAGLGVAAQQLRKRRRQNRYGSRRRSSRRREPPSTG